LYLQQAAAASNNNKLSVTSKSKAFQFNQLNSIDR